MTVIFCDIVGITSLSEVIDPEDLHELLSSYHLTCSKAVDRFDGFLADLMGDGVVIYFGYPKAHEDDEVRAVRCALAIQESIEVLRERIENPFQVRIGVHRGRVVVGALGGVGGPQSLAIGETPNITARLQAEAEPGDVIVSDSLWRLISPFFDGEDLGSRRLKGIRRPIEIYRVTKYRLGTSRKISSTSFLGREYEINQVQACWKSVLEDQPELILIRGEPGIGKSRLIQQIISKINDDDPVVLMAQCNSFASDAPFFPLAEMLRNRLDLSNLESADQLDALAKRLNNLGLTQPEALPLFALFLSLETSADEWSVLRHLSPVRQRQRTFELFREGLKALADEAPLALIVEDLHWADASTIEFLEQLLQLDAGEKIMVLLTSRLDFQASWMKGSLLTEIYLDSLIAMEAEVLIRNVASGKALPLELVRLICQRSGGNPLYLEEITLSVLASSNVIERETTWELVSPFSADLVPASLEAALMARLDKLGTEKALLQLGATLGREFRLDLLAAVASTDIKSVETVMQQMVEEGFLHFSERAKPSYIFKHALIQDVAYESLLRKTRQQNHARIALVITESFAELAKQRPELLAHHLSGAGQYAKATQLWLQAGQVAASRCAVNEAVEHLNRGLVDLEHLPPETDRWILEFSLQNCLAPVQMAAYGWASPMVETSCRRAIELTIHLTDNQHRFAPLWGLWSNRFVAGRLDAAMESALQLLAFSQSTELSLHSIAAYNAASYTHFYRGEYEHAIQAADAGLALYNRDFELELCMTLQSAPTVHILSARANSLWMQGKQREAHHGMQNMLKLARSLGHPPTLVAALSFLCFFYYYSQEWELIFYAAQEALQLSFEEGYALWHACANMYKTMAIDEMESSIEGINEVLEHAQLYRQTGSLVTDPSTATIIMRVLLRLGRLEDALEESNLALSSAMAGEVKVMVPEIYRCRGDVLSALGRFEEADLAYCQAVKSARAQSAASLELTALESLALHRRKHGNYADIELELQALFERLKPGLYIRKNNSSLPALSKATE
ncbi:MAG: ATP-binding protein [Cyanobacteriota bacterium]